VNPVVPTPLEPDETVEADEEALGFRVDGDSVELGLEGSVPAVDGDGRLVTGFSRGEPGRLDGTFRF
jgi:hypothetical protein